MPSSPNAPVSPSPGRSPPPPAPATSWQRWIPPAIALGAVAYLQIASAREAKQPTIDYSDFYALVTAGKVQSTLIKGQTITGKLKVPESLDGKPLSSFATIVPPQQDQDLLPLLRQKEVKIAVRSEEQPFVLQALLAVLPWILIVGVWVWISRRTQGMLSKGPFAALTKGHTRRYEQKDQVPVKFDDVAGLKAPKQDLLEIVEFLKEPTQFRRLGGRIPRGVLLIGPPGTGKTLLARAVAGEAGVPFFSISASEFIELFVGVGASRVRALFEEAKKVAPSIVFIDEIDAVGRSRGAGIGGGNDEREQTLNQLLAEMDGFTRSDMTVVLAATNRPDVLDPALLRPGRFDRRVLVDRPERAAREAILVVHTRGKPLAPGVDLDRVADNTPGFSGADLANLVNEAALNATRRHAESIEGADFTEAYDKIVLGDIRETVLDADEKYRVAVHEAGHAVVAHFTLHTEPLERVSILPRGMALGATHQTPAADRHILIRLELEARLQVLMGGYAAETLLLGASSSGAENDLKQATELALKMVAHFGMSERIGPVFHEHMTDHPFLGRTLTGEGGTSDATVHILEDEARTFLMGALTAANRTLTEHRTGLETLVKALLTQETVDRAELIDLLGPTSQPASAPVARANAAPTT